MVVAMRGNWELESEGARRLESIGAGAAVDCTVIVPENLGA